MCATAPLDSAYGGRLVFEPYQNGAVTVGSGWQTWSPLSGTWWATKTNAAGTGGAQVVTLPPGNCSQSTPCTWAQIKAAFPAAQVYGRFLLKAGSNWSGFDGNADALTVGVNYGDTTYDFEPDAPTPTSNPDSYRDGHGDSCDRRQLPRQLRLRQQQQRQPRQQLYRAPPFATRTTPPVMMPTAVIQPRPRRRRSRPPSPRSYRLGRSSFWPAPTTKT